MTTFFQVSLRTTDVEKARAFYASVLGPQPIEILQLHEQALARGARPHWLGYLDVEDFDEASAAFVARGATPLSAKWVNTDGLEAGTFRDPGGAVLLLGKVSKGLRARLNATPDVVWHLLHTADVERAKNVYGELFGWHFRAPLDLGTLGVFHPFSWQRDGAPIGSFTSIEGRPAIHPHWLFHFRVPAFERALEVIGREGGRVVGPFTLPSGERIAVCEDAQGAAFALRDA